MIDLNRLFFDFSFLKDLINKSNIFPKLLTNMKTLAVAIALLSGAVLL